MLTKEEIEVVAQYSGDDEQIQKLCDMALLALEEKALIQRMSEALKGLLKTVVGLIEEDAFAKAETAIAAAEKFLGKK